MIFFVTAYDEATRANHAIARRMIIDSDINLLEFDAVRFNLKANLCSSEGAIFSMAHGRTIAVIDNNGEYALHEADASLLVGFKVFAWGCHTSTTLGYKMSRSDVVWWGYDCAVTAPDDRIQYIDVFVRVFDSIKKLFVKGVNKLSVLDILEQIRILCVAAEEEFNILIEDDSCESFAVFSCCNNIWRQLLVWLPALSAPLRHPLAPAPYIEL
ncbi:hypothetical protein [Pseudomonas sp. CF150]|uniref:hypothetical protein n=1 Tax=Pseudomonas sp. CF150 TaxID=911240 RepID=UPI0003578E04|nr:hypothetical protein [Pseudomonas sp. CF150]EPL09852.1 hypothetical protein CF150_17073 [Pseudomonas sp. CF150]